MDGRVGAAAMRIAKPDRPYRGAPRAARRTPVAAGGRFARPCAGRRVGAGLPARAAGRRTRREPGHRLRGDPVVAVAARDGADGLAAHAGHATAIRHPASPRPRRDRARSGATAAGGDARSGGAAARGRRRGALPGGGRGGDRAVGHPPRARPHRDKAAGPGGGGERRDHPAAAGRGRAAAERGADALVGRRRTLHGAGGGRARTPRLRRDAAAPARATRRRTLAAGVGS